MTTFSPDQSANRTRALATAAAVGAAAGVAGAGVMALTEKLEQVVTGRPSSYVPGRTLLTLAGQSPAEDLRDNPSNLLMHYATGAICGSLRGVWSVIGIRGLQADAWHTVLRLGMDQTLENAAGVGAPPASWPVGERAVDLTHKAVYAFVTGTVADAVIAPTMARSRGAVSH